MKKKKQTKRALTASILSIVVCCALLVGSTFAWFTDSVTNSGNVIQSGKLDVTMEWRDGKEDPLAAEGWQDASGIAIFGDGGKLWEPGYTVARHVRIGNRGNLALKYEIRVMADGEVSELADVIDVYYIEGGQKLDSRDQLEQMNRIGTLADILADPAVANGHISAGEAEVATIVLKMQETADNKYQGMSIGTEFSIELVATQYTEEHDSFNDQYDKDAAYLVYVTTEEELKDAIANMEDGGTVVLNDDVTLTSPMTFSDKKIDIHLNEKKLKSTKAINLINATGSADVTVSGGALSVDNAGMASVVFAQDSARVCIENCDISYPKGTGYAVVTNGSQSKDATVVMRNTNITANQNYACYFPAGNIRLENCNVTGAVIISGGDVTIDGGTYKADGFSGQAKIWHEADTIAYLGRFATRDGCGHMGDSILIMDRRNSSYNLSGVTIKNVTFHTALTMADGSKATAYAIKYVDYENAAGVEPVKYVIENNTYADKMEGKDPLMFIKIK